MKYLLLIVIFAAATSLFLNRQRLVLATEASVSTTRQPRLPVSETLGLPGQGVLGESDVVQASPSDPLLPQVSGERSSLTAVPASVEADGVKSTTVVVTLRTEDGSLVSGAQVNLESNRGQQDVVEMVRGITGPDGQAIFLVRSLQSGTIILTAHAGTKLIDQKTTVKFTDAVGAAGFNTRIVWVGLAAIVVIIFFQYLFARLVLSARTRQEEELFFHHPSVLKSNK